MVRRLLGSIFSEIISKICATIFLCLLFWIGGLYFHLSLQERLALINIALAVSVIILLLYGRFVPKTRLIRHQGTYYLVEGRTCLHIPDPETFNYLGDYLGFSWNSAEEFTFEDIKRKFSMGKELPSIHKYPRMVENSKS